MKKKLNIDENKSWRNMLAILDSLPFYVLLVDEDHYIIQANKAVRSHLGVNRKDIVGQYCPKAVHGVDGPFYGCPLEEAVEKGKPVEREILDRETGRWLISAVYPTRVSTKGGRKIFLHMVNDISVRKQAEQELRVSRERLRSLSAHMGSVVEEERKKIAHDLHDETSQVVASIDALLEAAINKLPANTNEVKTILKQAQNFLVYILDQIRRLIYQLRPTILDDFGLVTATKWLLENNLQIAGIGVDFKVINKERTLTPELRIIIFRVIQEAISNISRHARAKNVAICLHFKKSSVKVSIKDDGIGFRVQDAINAKDRPRGLGLVGMEERVQALDGTFEIQSHSGYGTEINFEVPYENRVES